MAEEQSESSNRTSAKDLREFITLIKIDWYNAAWWFIGAGALYLVTSRDIEVMRAGVFVLAVISLLRMPFFIVPKRESDE